MSFLAGILTFALIANCVVLIFLVLIQLPKKDAGAGLAFGSGAADALFGAGSGNVLTKVTKWATVLFLLFCLVLAVVQDSLNNKGDASSWTKKVDERGMAAPAPAPTQQPVSQAAPAATATQPVPTLPAGISGAAVSTNGTK
ncbi:MAG TPA: preprotein translocase subunit SecG [Candidatus Sulfotelmatobacter sp.]|jgi:preprotein translocase subunit SecG|nr:preprotein translocase subunit SecG [Candidatus Sulfotelmatobacter sp.]